LATALYKECSESNVTNLFFFFIRNLVGTVAIVVSLLFFSGLE